MAFLFPTYCELNSCRWFFGASKWQPKLGFNHKLRSHKSKYWSIGRLSMISILHRGHSLGTYLYNLFHNLVADVINKLKVP